MNNTTEINWEKEFGQLDLSLWDTCDWDNPQDEQANSVKAFIRSKKAEWEARARETVSISEDNNEGKDEIYCDFYKCPKCSEGYITHGDKACPRCAVLLIWQ